METRQNYAGNYLRCALFFEILFNLIVQQFTIDFVSDKVTNDVNKNKILKSGSQSTPMDWPI